MGQATPEREFIQEQRQEPEDYYTKAPDTGTPLEWMGFVIIPLIVAGLGIWAQRRPPAWAQALLERHKKQKEK